MKRSVISSIALTAAMLLSTSAFAQTTIMGSAVSAEDLPKVQAACDTLAAKSKADDNASNTEAAKDTTAQADATASNDASTSTDATAGETDAGMNATTTTSIDLALLTYEECQKAGLVK